MSSIQRIQQLIKSNAYGGGTALTTSQDFNQINLAPCTHAKMSYAVKISANHKLVRGGKLPGLASAGTTEYTGGVIPSGTQGWSMRMMWHTLPDGKGYRLSAYPYLFLAALQKITLPATYVDYGGRVVVCTTLAGQQSPAEIPKRFLPNRYYKIEQEIKLNTPGLYDGVLRIAINNETLVYRNDVAYVTALNENNHIGRVMYHCFFGGGADWVTETDQGTIQIDIADIKVTVIA